MNREINPKREIGLMMRKKVGKEKNPKREIEKKIAQVKSEIETLRGKQKSKEGSRNPKREIEILRGKQKS